MVLFLSLVSGACAQGTLDDLKLTVVGEEYAPYSFLLDGIPAGLSVDIVENMTLQAGIPFSRSDIILQTWEEALDATISGENTLLLAVYRTPEREDQMQFIGPVATESSAVFVNSGFNQTISSTQDLLNLKIGVISGDAHETLLAGYGIIPEHITTAPNLSALISLVQDGSVDAIFHGEQAVNHVLSGSINDPLTIAFRTDEESVWFGLSPDIPEETVLLLQSSLTDVLYEEQEEAISVLEESISEEEDKSGADIPSTTESV
jgi:polar amino acid transport system substrate-binding protein